jgi:SAM-dependent methyltransferase
MSREHPATNLWDNSRTTQSFKDNKVIQGPSVSCCVDEGFVRGESGILVPTVPVAHREDEYDPEAFKVLRDMQSRHFWYKGRHRFLLAAVRRAMSSRPPQEAASAIDLGCGCGGWTAYVQSRTPKLFREFAIADSSTRALAFAEKSVGPDVKRYQLDLLNLPWTARWDAAFLLDVIEHIPDHIGVLRQVAKALKPGGYLFVTTPALKCFWSYNDDMAQHLRRYSRRDYDRLAQLCDLQLQAARYFMFFLSPLLVLSRWRSPDVASMSYEEIRQHLARTHRVPPGPINKMLEGVFSLETPVGAWVPFPWGTSILGVFQKRA